MMNSTIGRIAWLELKSFFYSPIAWLTLIIFVFQCNLLLSEKISAFVQQQELNLPLADLTNYIFRDYFTGFFRQVQDSLYLYIPLLTMGSFSRERSSGSLRLLYSSPVKLKEIVLGKFLGIQIYGALLIGMLLLLTLVSSKLVVSFDLGSLWAGLLGLLLLTGAYVSIGLFLSSLTVHQVVAAISTLAVLGGLTHIGEVGQEYAVVRWISAILSLPDHTEYFFKGLLSTKDLIYFLLVILFFLGLTLMKLNGERFPAGGLRNSRQLTGLLAGLFFIGYLSSLPGFIAYQDTTVNESNTIRPVNRQLLKDLKGPLTITYYINLLDDWSEGGFGIPHFRNLDLRTWEPYQRWKPDMQIRFVYYYDRTSHSGLITQYPDSSLEALARMRARRWDMDMKKVLSPAQIRREIDLLPYDNIYTIQLAYENRRSYLHMYDYNYVPGLVSFVPQEAEIMAAIKKLVAPSPTVGFLADHYERSIGKEGKEGYSDLATKQSFRKSLVNQGFAVVKCSLSEGGAPVVGYGGDSGVAAAGGAGGVLRMDLSVLVIAAPQDPYNPAELDRLKHYIDGGGNLLILSEPGNQAVVNPLLRLVGVRLKDGMVVDPDGKEPPGVLPLYFHGNVLPKTFGLARVAGDSVLVNLHGAAGLEYGLGGAFEIKPLLVSGAASWTRLRPMSITDTIIRMDTAAGDLPGSQVIGIRMSRNRGKAGGREQKIVVLGTTDLFSNAYYTWDANLPEQNGNVDCSLAIFSWFCDGRYPMSEELVPAHDTAVTIGLAGARWLRRILLIIFPLLMAAAGTYILIRRMSN